ncbi:MAG: DUF2442 domain-containing protein [Verrucomicrobiales bacterium]|jgi:hypothetical protein|nr:DUF2442 domain-containing protein [Verrucomicrobiales bacterium]
MLHKVKTVTPLANLTLAVEFQDGTRKQYDVTPLIAKWEPFGLLKSLPGIFERVRVDWHGYGIVWNDELDLSCEELWVNGRPV